MYGCVCVQRSRARTIDTSSTRARDGRQGAMAVEPALRGVGSRARAGWQQVNGRREKSEWYAGEGGGGGGRIGECESAETGTGAPIAEGRRELAAARRALTFRGGSLCRRT